MDQRMNFGDDITSQLRLAKKHHFTKQEEKRVSQEIELQVRFVWPNFIFLDRLVQLTCVGSGRRQMYLNRLIREDRDRQIERVSDGKEYSAVEDEISNIEIIAASLHKAVCIISAMEYFKFWIGNFRTAIWPS